jgi:hypothetical protein
VPAPVSPAGDELDRLFGRVVANLVALDPSRVHGPVAVAELYQQLVPYRTHRTSLAIDTHEDYEMALLRLLAGERGYAFLEPDEARAALAAEAASINPDTGLYRRFGGATVTFDPEHVRTALGAGAPPAADASAASPEPSAPRAPRAPAREPEWFPEVADEADGGPAPDAGEAEDAAERLRFALEDDAAPAPSVSPRVDSATCAFCGGALPLGRAVIFCPHCGQNVGIVHCPSCGAELDVGWRFCITCGRQMADLK